MKKRGFGEGRWNGVGGKLDEGESAEQAAIRETKEEILVTPTATKKVAELHFDEFHKGKPYRIKVHVFTCIQWQGTPTETEEMAPKWFTLDELPLANMWPDDKFWLEKVLHGAIIRGQFTLDKNDRIIKHQIEEVSAL
jgi:8-oxo-dGTP pyrophosphatase MutT (NUDIX family)